MVILFTIFKLSLQQDFNLAVQDLSDPFTVNGWNIVTKGIVSGHQQIIYQCDQNLLKIAPYPDTNQKTYVIPHLDYNLIYVEMDVYFIQFSQSFIRIKIDEKIIFQQTFSTTILQSNNICGGSDSQYTILQKFHSSKRQFTLSIFYWTSADSQIGIRNLNIYTNGYILSNGCSMEQPYLQDTQCVKFCSNTNAYLGGVGMLECQTDMIGQSSLIGQYLTTQIDLWQFTISEAWVNPSSSQYLNNSNLYTNIMYSDLFSSTLNCQQQCFYITQNIQDTYLLQITFVFYIFGEWDDGSQVGLFIAGDAIYQNNMVKIGKVNGEYYSSTGSDIYFTNNTSTTGILNRVRWTLISFQGKFYSSTVSIGFSQQIYGSGSYGFGDIYLYQSYNDPKIVSSGLYGIPYQCVTNFYAYNGYCVQKCPPYSFQDEYNNNCTDLAYQLDCWPYQKYDWLLYYQRFLQQQFQQLNNQLDIQYNTPFIQQLLKWITIFIYRQQGWGSYGLQINLPIHQQIRIQFTLYLIDQWQANDKFQYLIDGNLIQGFEQNSQSTQIQGHANYDQKVYVSNTISHNQQQLKLMFTCTLQSRNSIIASCGISDLFILYDQLVDAYCNLPWLYFSYFTNNCEQCLVSDCQLYPDYYIGFNSKSIFGCLAVDQAFISLCQICIEPNYEDINADGQCECAPQYIQQNNQCEMCHYSCETCFGISQFQCKTCQLNRYLSNLNSCQCQTGYIDLFARQECQIIKNSNNNCDQTCLTCSNTQYHQCVSCSIDSFRILNLYNVCLCNQQYMDVGSQICQKTICDLTCLTCHGLLESNCITCGTNFIFDNGYCICNGLFNNLVNINVCLQNNPNCNQIKCQDQFISGFMDCDPIQFRYLIIISSQQQICACIDGYYDQQGVCEECDSTCLTCSNLAQCLTCDEKTNRILKIYKCECIIGYNDKLFSGQVCVQNFNKLDCHFSCSECFGTLENQCLTCIENRYLSQQSCICQMGYFELQGGCNKCHFSCLSCSTGESLNCLDCNSYHLRILDNNQCKCITGYADVGNQQCEGISYSYKTACPHDCGECNSSLKCVTCKISSHILNKEGFCVCQPGYQKDQNEQCVDCYKIQGRALDLCQYTDFDDGVWTQGEKCDDGNMIDRDGCKQFLIDKGYQCDNTLLQPSICYKCPTNCQNCYFNESVYCETCIDKYFQHDGICYQCYDSNCLVCKSQSLCIKCIKDIIPINGLCNICEQGYEYKNKECESICGDGILTQEEQCDDLNVYNNDGCSQNCQIELGFICNPECVLEENVIKAKLLESGSKVNNIQIEILYYEFDINQLDVKIEYLNLNEDYTLKTTLINENKFEIQFTFTKPIKQFNIIHIYIPIQSQKRLLENQIREYTFTPVETDYYDSSQMSQRTTIQNTQKQFYQSLAFIGPITFIIGGTSFFLQILDIISWINNFYYININYPGNVQIFFEKTNWGLIFTFPQIFEFQTDNVNQIPQRFQDKGIDGLLINNVQQIMFIYFTVIICIYASRRIQKYIQRYQSRNKQVISLLQNDLIRQSKSDLQVQQIKSKKQNSQIPQINEQNKINRLLQQLSQKLLIFYENRYLIILQIMNTLILDIFLGLFINLKYQNYYNDFISFLSLVFCILFGILSLIFFYLLYIIVTGHNILKKLKFFRKLANQLFEGLKSDKISRLYGFQSILQKTLFIISIVVFYERPLAQTLVCSSVLLGLLLISIYQYPYLTYKDVLSQFIPDVSLAFILFLCTLLAADEQINYFSYQQRYNVGWVMLAIISLSIIIQLLFIIKEAYEWILIKLKWIRSLINK